MEHVISPAKKLRISFRSTRHLCLAATALALFSPMLSEADGPNLLPAGSFENVLPTYVPWAGVDGSGNIHGIEGKQIAVGDDGSISNTNFGPGVASADMNGDGKPDIVMADTHGYFWFYPNSGTPQKPEFTQGEVIPVWLGETRQLPETEGVDNIIARIQLLDLDDSKKLQIIAGSYQGKLIHFPNIGSSSSPNFKPIYDTSSLTIPTHKRGVLWCNYLAPVLTGAFRSGAANVFDLIMGEGTYSANSVYMLHNTSGAGNMPSFDEDHLQKIIPGMGSEQLTPAVVDWNNDGKPDILYGDRTGYIHLWLNNSADQANPTFAPYVNPTAPANATNDVKSRLTIGGTQKLGGSISIAIADLTDNKLPNLLIGKDDGTVVYALNTGTLGSPVFTTPLTPIKGVLPPTYHYTSLTTWTKAQAFGVPDELVGAVNPSLEPGFKFPEGSKAKYALKFWLWPVTNTYFPERFSPREDNEWQEHLITTNQRFNVDLNKRYRIHAWMKADRTVSDFHYHLWPAGTNREGFHGYDIVNPISCGSSWTEVTSEFEVRNPDDPTVKTWNYGINFFFKGQPTIYMCDLTIQAAN